MVGDPSASDAAPVESPAGVDATEAARELIRSLTREHGPLLFHQSGGCCDGSSPMCYPRAEFRIGSRDVLLGSIDDTPVYIGGRQYERWKHTRLTLDVVPGRGGGFSLEAPRNVRFITLSDLCEVSPAEGT